MLKISVIVPVYNAEKYIGRCIDSLLVQTFTDFELLLVDDGSQDDSGEICDAYALKDSRVRVFHKNNGGVSSARNLGIDNSKGIWILFVDADDWVDTNLFEIMVSEYEKNRFIDIIGFGLRTVDVYGEPIEELYGYDKTDIKSVNCIPVDYGFYAFFYKKEILDLYCLRFPIGIKVGEDQAFTLKYLTVSDKLLAIANVKYNYRKHPQSVMNRPFDLEKIKDHLRVLDDFIVFIKQVGVEKLHYSVIRKLERLLTGYFYFANKSNLSFFELVQLRNCYISFFKRNIKYKKLFIESSLFKLCNFWIILAYFRLMIIKNE